MRFQPVSGQLLAAASEKIVSVFNVETDRQTHSFQVCVPSSSGFILRWHLLPTYEWVEFFCLFVFNGSDGPWAKSEYNIIAMM